MENTVSDLERARIPTATQAEALTYVLGGAQQVFMGAPVLADVDLIVTACDFDDGALSIAAQPPVPSNITAVLADVNSSVTAGTLTITGLDPQGRTVVEVLNPRAGAGLTLTGTKIFASVTSVVVSGAVGTDHGVDQLTVGVGNVIGLPFDLPTTSLAAVKHVYLGGVRQASPVVTTGVSTTGINVAAGTYDGTKLMYALVMPNARN